MSVNSLESQKSENSLELPKPSSSFSTKANISIHSEKLKDFIVTNRKIHANQIQDVRTLNANTRNDYSIVLGKFELKMQPRKSARKTTMEKINIEALWHEITKELYQNRLKEKIENDSINIEED